MYAEKPKFNHLIAICIITLLFSMLFFGCLSDLFYEKTVDQREVKVLVIESEESGLTCNGMDLYDKKNVGQTLCCSWSFREEYPMPDTCSPMHSRDNKFCYWENKEPNSYQVQWFTEKRHLEDCNQYGKKEWWCKIDYDNEEVIALQSYCADCRLDICSAVTRNNRIYLTAVQNFCPIEYPESQPACEPCDPYDGVATRHVHYIRIPKTDHFPIYITIYTGQNDDAEACEYPEEPPT